MLLFWQGYQVPATTMWPRPHHNRVWEPASIWGEAEGAGPGAVGSACCSPLYSPRMTGLEPAQTRRCLKCCPVCWPPGSPRKEQF